MTTEDTPAGGGHDGSELPFSARSAADAPGHWLLARLGKTVLRPGGRQLSQTLVQALPVAGHDVVELAPGLGLTARLLLDERPASYVGIEENPAAAQISAASVGAAGKVVVGNAKRTGLADESCDVVVTEAMLTMNTTESKGQILDEVWRILRPNGFYAIHELSLTPDDISDDVAADVRVALARSIKVNARPLTVTEWRTLFEEHGFRVQRTAAAKMALLQVRRVIADEGLARTLRIGRNYLRDADARARVNAMRRTFRRHRRSIGAVAIVAQKVPLGSPPAG